MSLFEKHQASLKQAVNALHARTFFAAFPENPSPTTYGETADVDGQAKFKSRLGHKFEDLKQSNPEGWAGQEESPYLQEPLKVAYPIFSVSTLVDRASKALNGWRKISAEDRAGILMESLDGMKGRFFEIAYATMHTTGQGYMMAFQASGPHAADRALEAIASGFEELNRFPSSAIWEKPMGKYNLQLQKEWRAVPKGISVVIGCSTFPTWNSVTGIYGSLMTGNPVIVKPHPGAILPIAIVVAEIQKVLVENNLDPNICQLAVDTFDKMITKELAEDPDVKLIDFTGNSAFGSYLEALPGKTVFTEKTGVNSVILDSVEDIDKVAANIAFSVNLYSGQMCTAPQNSAPQPSREAAQKPYALPMNGLVCVNGFPLGPRGDALPAPHRHRGPRRRQTRGGARAVPRRHPALQAGRVRAGPPRLQGRLSKRRRPFAAVQHRPVPARAQPEAGSAARLPCLPARRAGRARPRRGRAHHRGAGARAQTRTGGATVAGPADSAGGRAARKRGR